MGTRKQPVKVASKTQTAVTRRVKREVHTISVTPYRSYYEQDDPPSQFPAEQLADDLKELLARVHTLEKAGREARISAAGEKLVLWWEEIVTEEPKPESA